MKLLSIDEFIRMMNRYFHYKFKTLSSVHLRLSRYSKIGYSNGLTTFRISTVYEHKKALIPLID